MAVRVIFKRELEKENKVRAVYQLADGSTREFLLDEPARRIAVDRLFVRGFDVAAISNEGGVFARRVRRAAS